MVAEALNNNPLFLIFIVAAIGYLIGKIKIKGTGLGTAAVLFVGLAFGALNPGLKIPQIVFEMGIVLFVYTIGLGSGPAFFNSFKKNGWRDISFVILMLSITAIIAAIMFWLGDIDKETLVGVYSGSTTNTTALASVIDMINYKFDKADTTAVNQLVVGYTFSYPMGVLGVMIAIKIMEKFFNVDYQQERQILRKDYPLDEDLTHRTILIENPDIIGLTLRDILKSYQWNIVFGRYDSVTHGTILPNWDIKVNAGDKIILVGTEEGLDQAQKILGSESDTSLSHDRREYDVVRIFVSNSALVGKEISSLNLQEQFSVMITRIRRGDVEMLAKADTILELGDRIRFVAKRKDIKAIQTLFGDSYHQASKIDLFSFGVGIALGLILGMIEFHVPGGMVFKLGFAGGPLIAGLILGALRRTGPIVWALPYGSNVTLNQLGLTLLLTVIGVSSGTTLLESLGKGDWIPIFMAGTFLSIISTILSLWIGYKLIKIPYSLLLGFVSNQPAILEFATDITKNRVPAIGYAFMFPISLIMKILFAQMLFLFL
jgi:putative transport protein